MINIILLLVTLGAVFFTGSSSAVDFTAQTGFQYDYWDDNKDNKASQAYIPVKFEASHDEFSAVLLVGYANTHIESTGGNESLSHILDTKLNLSYEISDKLPVDVLIGLDFNFPTGKTNFNQEELIIIMDPDLISIDKFGEGYNINPTVSVVKDWGDLVAGIGLGYLWRGEYEFSEDLKDYDPGDIFNTSAELRYYFHADWNARVFGYYAHYGKDEEEGRDFAQEGDHYLAGIGIHYDQIEWVAGLTFQGVFRDKSKFQEAAGGLFTEDNNSQGDEWITDLFVTYNLNDSTAVKSNLQFLYIEKNDFPQDSPRFIGSREKVTLKLGAEKTFDNDIQGEVSLKGFVMRDAETNFPEPRESTNYTGFSAMVSVTKVY